MSEEQGKKVKKRFFETMEEMGYFNNLYFEVPIKHIPRISITV